MAEEEEKIRRAAHAVERPFKIAWIIFCFICRVVGVLVVGVLFLAAWGSADKKKYGTAGVLAASALGIMKSKELQQFVGFVVLVCWSVLHVVIAYNNSQAPLQPPVASVIAPDATNEIGAPATLKDSELLRTASDSSPTQSQVVPQLPREDIQNGNKVAPEESGVVQHDMTSPTQTTVGENTESVIPESQKKSDWDRYVFSVPIMGYTLGASIDEVEGREQFVLKDTAAGLICAEIFGDMDLKDAWSLTHPTNSNFWIRISNQYGNVHAEAYRIPSLIKGLPDSRYNEALLMDGHLVALRFSFYDGNSREQGDTIVKSLINKLRQKYTVVRECSFGPSRSQIAILLDVKGKECLIFTDGLCQCTFVNIPLAKAMADELEKAEQAEKAKNQQQLNNALDNL